MNRLDWPRDKARAKKDRENTNLPAPAHCPDLQTLPFHKEQMKTPALQFHCHGAAVNDYAGLSGSGIEIMAVERQE